MLLQDLALIILQRGLTSRALINQEEDPCHYGIDDKEVDVYDWNVFVPNRGEVRVEGKILNREEILDAWGDDGDEGDVVAGLEAENVGVDQQRDEDGVEDDKACVDGGLDEHAWWFGGRTHEVYQLVDDQTENVVGDAGYEDNCVLDALRDLNTCEVGLADLFDGTITEGGN